MSKQKLEEMLDFEARDAEEAEAAEAKEPEATEEASEAPEKPVEASEEAEGTDVPEEAPEAVEELTTPPEGIDVPSWLEEMQSDPIMGKYKTPEEMVKGFKEYQSHADRQLAEERARREAYEQMISAEQQMMQQQQAMEIQQPVEVGEEDLAAGIKQAPIDTFQWAVQNNPSLVPKIIAGVAEEHGTATGMELNTAWTNIQLQAQQAQMQQEMQAALEPQMVQQSIGQGLNAVEQKYGEDFNALRGEVAEGLKELGQLPSYDPQTIAQAVEYTFLQAHRNRALQAASQAQEQPRTPSPQETIETGTPGQAPVVTDSDELKQGILDAYNQNPYH